MLSKVYQSTEDGNTYIVVGLTHDELLQLGSGDEILKLASEENKVVMAIVSGKTDEDLYSQFLKLIQPEEDSHE